MPDVSHRAHRPARVLQIRDDLLACFASPVSATPSKVIRDHRRRFTCCNLGDAIDVELADSLSAGP